MTKTTALCTPACSSGARSLKYALACSLFALSLFSSSAQPAHAAPTSAGVDSTVTTLPIAVQGIAGITLYASSIDTSTLAATPNAPTVVFNGPIREGILPNQTVIDTSGNATFGGANINIYR